MAIRCYQSVEAGRYCPYLISMNNLPPTDSQFWVFGYGSLMWDPGFAFIESARAKIYGYHRSLCIISTHYRGTADNPGLVLGLDRGGSCTGRAFRVAPKDLQATLAYLQQREQVTMVYREFYATIKLADGRALKGYTFVARHDHHQYVHLSLEQQARMVASGVGSTGSAFDYLANTVAHLSEHGIHDTDLHRVLARAQILRQTPPKT